MKPSHILNPLPYFDSKTTSSVRLKKLPPVIACGSELAGFECLSPTQRTFVDIAVSILGSGQVLPRAGAG